jgi:amino acid transporter
MISLIVVLLVLGLWLLVTVSSQSPGTIPEMYDVHQYFPFVWGYMNMFSISYKSSLILCMIPSFGTCYAMIYIITKQLHAMASSGFLPEILLHQVTLRKGEEKVPLLSHVLICSIGYFTYFFARSTNIITTYTQIASVAGCFVYFSMFYCYVMFRRRYSHMERNFKNPFSYVSVIIGIFVYFIGIFYVLVDDPTPHRAVTIFYFSYITFMILYYYFFAQWNQQFSESEQATFFKLYVMNSK